MWLYLDSPNNWVDLVLVGLIGLGLVLGLIQGLVRQVLTLGALYVSAVLALQYYSPVARYAQLLWPHTDDWSRTTFGMAFVFVVSFSVLNLLSYSLYQETRLSTFSVFDHLSGALAGGAGSWVLSSIAANLLGLSFRFTWGGWEDFEAGVQSQFNQSVLVPILYAHMPLLYDTIRPWLPAGLPLPFLI